MDCTSARRSFGRLGLWLCVSLLAAASPAGAQPATLETPSTRGGGFVFRKTADDAGQPIYAKARAIVIGINDYAELPKLSGAVRDADTVAADLTARGFEVTLLKDGEATRKRIARLLGDELPEQVGPDDAVLVYFAGHGVSTGKGDSALGYIMPVEASRDSPRTDGVSMRELTAWFNDYPSKHVMFVADACYSGLVLSTRSVGLSPGTRDYMQQVTSKRVRLALVAGGAGEEALELNGQGLFTTYFLEAIRGNADGNKDGIITSDEIAAYVKPSVTQAAASQFSAKQNPQMGRTGEGEFVFLNPSWKPLEPTTVAMLIDPGVPGASVTVDGVQVCSQTPCSPQIAFGERMVTIAAPEHEPRSERVTVTASMASLDWKLKAIPKDFPVRFASATPGARVLIGGAVVCGQLPCDLKLKAGTYQLAVLADGYDGRNESFTVTNGPLSFQFDLTPVKKAPAPVAEAAVAKKIERAEGGRRAAPIGLLTSGAILVAVGAGLHGYNATLSAGDGTATAASAVGCYGVGGILLLAGIIDGAVNGWREKPEALGELQLRDGTKGGPSLAVSGGIENGMALKGAW